MSQKSNIWLAPLFILLVSCSAEPVTPVVSRPANVERSFNDGLTDDYVEFVEQGRSALRDGHLEAAESNFIWAAQMFLLERANYEVWIELAEVKCRLGKIAEARAWIADYGIALKIDLQIETCREDWGEEMTVSPNPRIPLRMYAVMCNAFVQGYGFVNLTDEDKRTLEAFYQGKQHEILNLDGQCTALSD